MRALVGLLFFCPILSAGIISNLATDWSNTVNPNGLWTYAQATTPLVFDATLDEWTADANATLSDHDYLPLWGQVTPGDANGVDYVAGNIVVHSVDSANGTPANGEATLLWVSPFTGLLDITGDIWFAHSQFPTRSNDYTLMLGSTVLTTGSVNQGDSSLGAPIQWNFLSVPVTTGEVLSLVIQRSSGQTLGSFDGVNLTLSINLPEPSPAWLLAAGMALFGLYGFYRRRSA